MKKFKIEVLINDCWDDVCGDYVSANTKEEAIELYKTWMFENWEFEDGEEPDGVKLQEMIDNMPIDVHLVDGGEDMIDEQ